MLPEIEQPATMPEIDEDELCENVVTGWENRPSLYLNGPPRTTLTIGPLPIPSTCPHVLALWMRRTITAPYSMS